MNKSKSDGLCNGHFYNGEVSKTSIKMEIFHHSIEGVESSMISKRSVKKENVEGSSDISTLTSENRIHSDSSENIHYVTDGDEQTVAFVYPRSALPLLSSNNQGYVNLVELPHMEGVDGTLQLDNSLEYQGSVVLQNGFENDSQITVMTTSDADGHLQLIEAHDMDNNEDESVSYLRSSSVGTLDNSSCDNENSMLSDQLMSIPTSDVVTKLTNGSTIALPISFVSESVEVSLLRSLRHLPITIGDNSQEATLSIPVSLQSDYIVPNGPTNTSEYIIPDNVMAEHEESSETLHQHSGLRLNNSKHLNKSFSTKSACKLSIRPINVQVGCPPRKKKNKFIGTGPTAISAQGVIKEIGNRLVTVLPRPEDLKKLMDNKQFVLAVQGCSVKCKRKTKKTILSDICPKYKQRHKKTYPLWQNTEKPIKDSMVDMTLSQGNLASAVFVGEIEDMTDYLDEDFSPQKLYKPRKRKKKRGRGKWKKEGEIMVISSSGRRPGRPKKVKTLMEGPNGPKIIQTGPVLKIEDKSSDGEGPCLTQLDIKEEKNSICESSALVSTLEDQESCTLTEQIVESTDIANCIKNESVVKEKNCDKFTKRKLPPRNRGVKYQKLIEMLRKSDDDFEISSDEELYSKSSHFIGKPPDSSKLKGKSGPGKRGRPRKIVAPDIIDNGGTTIIKLNESLKPIESTSSSVILIGDENVENGDMSNLQHKLVITFEQPDTGEMVMQQISIQPSENKSEEILESRLMTDPDTNITLVQSSQGITDNETATIFVAEDGKFKHGYHCEECGKITQFKRDHMRHMQQAHYQQSFECIECKKTFASKIELLEHSYTHNQGRSQNCNHFKDLTEPTSDAMFDCDLRNQKNPNFSQFQHNTSEESFSKFKCTSCEQSFDSEDQLNQQHSQCPNDVKEYVCDICQHKFVSSIGLNRHRKVHNRYDEASTKELFKCRICYATFSFQASMLLHIKMVHEGNLLADKKSGSLISEKQVIKQLQDRLNEGYAPKTSELYDVPKEDETIETPTKEPFLCGICDEPFKDIDQLCDHYTSCHMGDQTIYCNICSVGCSFLSQLEKHKLIHIEEERKALKPSDLDLDCVCSLCRKHFKTESELEKHLKMHGQKQFKCSYCNGSFTIKSALDKHILVHTGQRPFHCDICLKSFRQSAALVRHKLWTHKLKNQNKCELCGKTFFTLNLLLYHLDVHGEESRHLREQLLQKKKDNGGIENNSNEEGVEKRKIKNASGLGPISKTCEYCGKECASLVALLTHKITHKLSASYKCDQCHRTFREKKYLKKHKLTHGLKTWQCDICSKSFATKLTLIRHSHVHLREALRPVCQLSGSEKEDNLPLGDTLPSVLKCEECNILFSHKSHYVRHKLLHSGIPLLKCGLCDKMFVHKSDIIRHKVMHSLMFTCNICGRNFHKRSLYIMHKKRHSDAKPFKCDHCNKSFATSGNFKTHLRIHSGEKPFQCNICNYRCSQSGRLLKHKQMHSGEKSSSCNYCGKGFANAESVKSHERLHTGERPYKCSDCQKSFINSTSLNTHIRDHWKEQLYKCEDCPHKFRRNDHLEKHKLFHQMQQHYQQNKAMGLDADSDVDSPLYMCDICGRVFDRKKYLYTHHNVHSRQKVYTCNLCQKSLASRMALKNHLMIHSGEMPHKCNLCEKVFRNLSNLKRHEKVHCTQEMLNCEECGETFYSSNLLKEHKQAHVNLMMINSQVDTADGEASQQLYVFEDAMDTTQQLLVNSSQQQFLVDNSQSLLVFSESGNEQYEIQPPQSPSDEEASPPPASPPQVEDSVPSPGVGLDQEEEELRSLPMSSDKTMTTPMLSEEVDEEEEEEEEEEKEVQKPHQCEFCPKSFAKKQYLTKHKYRHREVKPHGCDICGKRFAQKFEVAVHKIRHTGEKPYKCEFCHKDFRSKVNLTNHKMRHTGEYPYLCSVCNKGLSTQLQLERHVSLHTGAQPFQCDMCMKGYFQEISLLRHLTKVHNIQTVSSFEAIQPLENSEAAEQMEVMEAISTISNIPPLANDKHTMTDIVNENRKHLIKEESDLEDEMEVGIVEELSDSHFEENQPEYFKNCLLDSSSKLLNIFQQVRVEEENLVNDADINR